MDDFREIFVWWVPASTLACIPFGLIGLGIGLLDGDRIQMGLGGLTLLVGIVWTIVALAALLVFVVWLIKLPGRLVLALLGKPVDFELQPEGGDASFMFLHATPTLALKLQAVYWLSG